MVKKNLIIITAILAVTLMGCGESPIVQDELATDEIQEEVTVPEETESTEETPAYSEPLVFEVAPRATPTPVSEEEYSHIEYEDTPALESVDMEPVDDYGSVILTAIDGFTLEAYTSEAKLGVYSHTYDGQRYYVFIMLYDYEPELASDLEDRTEDTLCGPVKFYQITDMSGSRTYGKVQLSNGLWCTIHYNTMIDFDTAVERMVQIFNEGIVVVSDGGATDTDQEEEGLT